MGAQRYEISLWAINLTAQEWVQWMSEKWDIELNIRRELCINILSIIFFDTWSST